MTIRRVFLILLVAELFNFGIRETLDPDLWWHLRTGELIVQQGLPQRDVFSFTVPEREWITHEWLSDVLMWRGHELIGLNGLIVVFAALGALAFWLVFLCSAGQPYLAGAIVALARFAAAPAFGVRPQVLNVLMAATFVWLIEMARDGRLPRRALFALPLLTVVWVNLHSGYLLGVALLLTYAAGEGMELASRPASERVAGRADLRLWLTLALLCVVAGLANPNGWRLMSFPLGTLSSTLVQEQIAEWGSPDFHRWVYWPFAVLFALGVIGWISNPTRPSWRDVLLFFGTAAAGLYSERHIALFAVVATPIVCRALAQSRYGAGVSAVARDESAPLSRRRAGLNWVILVVGLISVVIPCAARLSKNDAAIAREFPIAAVDFLEREGLAKARGYNTYGWGGYLIWRRIPVFVDGRAELYGDFLAYYLKTFRLQHDWRKPLEDFGIRYVLLEKANPLGTLLTASGEWRAAYADEVAEVFVPVGNAQR